VLVLYLWLLEKMFTWIVIFTFKQKISTSLLHYGFGLTNQEYLKTGCKNSNVYFYIKIKEDKLQCSNCGSFHFLKKGTIKRLFETVLIGLKPVFLKAKTPTFRM